MKFSSYSMKRKMLNAITTIAGASLVAASAVKILTIINLKNNIDPALFFLTTVETQTLAGLVEIATAFVLLSKTFSINQKYIALVCLTTLLCAYRYFSLPLTNCGCLGNFESEWLKAISSITSTVLLAFYFAVSVLLGLAAIYSTDANKSDSTAA
jgi:hypothetical protein